MSAEEKSTSKSKETTRHADTKGGSYVGGNVNIGGGDFVARDDRTSTRGAAVSGQRINTSQDPRTHLPGDPAGTQRIGFGPGADPKVVEEVTSQVLLSANVADDPSQAARRLVQELLTELALGAAADDFRVAERLQRCVSTFPNLAQPLLQLFANPALAENQGPATLYILSSLG